MISITALFLLFPIIFIFVSVIEQRAIIKQLNHEEFLEDPSMLENEKKMLKYLDDQRRKPDPVMKALPEYKPATLPATVLPLPGPTPPIGVVNDKIDFRFQISLNFPPLL